jgi:hypothetical protein
MRIENRVIVVRKLAHAGALKRGDVIAYNLGGVYRDGVNAHGGPTLGKILGLPGDRIDFSPESFAVNGIAQPRLPHMPASGGMVVPENNWFIWPNLAITGGHGNVGEAMISDIMLQMAAVPQSDFSGKPFKRWFGRPQAL